MSVFGANFIKNVDKHLSVDGQAPALSFREGGYLFLAANDKAMFENTVLQKEHGANVALLNPQQLKERFPWLHTDDITCGSLGLSNEGWLDAYALLQGFKTKARALGADYIRADVTALQREKNRISGVQLDTGSVLKAGHVINAAGPRAGDLAALVGIALPVRPRKRQVFVFSSEDKITGSPLIIDPSGVYWRPEGSHFICGNSPPEHQDPDCYDFEVDYDQFEQVLWPALAARVPAFERIKLIRAWAGHYDYNTWDQNAILGPHPDLPNFVFANGFSGHGLQHSPAAGRADRKSVV